MKQIIQKRKIWLLISGSVIIISVIFLIIWGLNAGIDFTGGSLLEIKFKENIPTTESLRDAVAQINLEGDVNIQATENDSFIIRFQSIEENTHQQIMQHLRDAYDQPEAESSVIVEERYEAIGPAIGKELQNKAVYSIIIVLICIVLYIAWAFRKVSFPVKSWKYGIIAIVALFHDVLITLGIFAVLGHFGVEVGLPFVAALLTILGYSVNDTIVVFDRIRENLSRLVKTDFESIVNRSVNETITRSVNTSLTTLLVLLAIFLFGGSSIQFFILALICGVILGTYSSIFIASPLLVVWEKWGKNNK